PITWDLTFLMLIQHHHVRDHARTTTRNDPFVQDSKGGLCGILRKLHDASCYVNRKIIPDHTAILGAWPMTSQCLTDIPFESPYSRLQQAYSRCAAGMQQVCSCIELHRAGCLRASRFGSEECSCELL